MGRACITNGRGMYTSMLVSKGNYWQEDLHVHGKILIWTVENRMRGCMNWIHMAQNRKQQQALVNMVIYRPVP
jgi:hypothetical protein